MKKTGLFLTFLLLGLGLFAQYTDNKLPSGLTVADTANDADYTIIQKSRETYVKAIRMDSLRSYMTEGMAENVIELDSVAGNTGQFIISDGSGWLAPVSAKYEGSDAYTFGSRLSGAIGSGSIVLGRGRATAARSFTINGITASGTDAIAINGAIASGNRSTAINQGTASGNNSFAVGSSSVASGDKSVALSGGTASGGRSIAWNGGDASGNSSTAWNSGDAQSYLETSFGRYSDTAATKDIDSWVTTDRLLTIGNGTSGSPSNALVMLKNGNTTATGNWTIDGDLTVTGNISTSVGARIGAYIPEDSTLTQTVVANVWEFMGDGDNNKFVNIYTNSFTFTGDTLQYTGEDSIYAHIEWGGTVESSVVTTDVCVTIYINDVEQPQFKTSTRTGTAGELYPLAGCSNIALLPPDATIKIYVRANKNCNLTFHCFPINLHQIR